MENEFDYLVADENCKQAMNELLLNANKEQWLRKYKRLFNKVTICPTGLPSTANSNFDGVNYGFVREFHNAYQLIHLEQSKQIVNCFK